MQFNSYTFVLFFLPIAVFGYHMLNKKYQKPILARLLIGVLSLVFIGWEDGTVCLIFLLSMCWNYLAVKAIKRISVPKSKKLVFILALLGHVGFLIFYKYANFILDNAEQIFHMESSWHQNILPLGISFYTFTQISYLVDCYRGECEDHTLGEYLSYMLFFPKWLQGPIVLQKDFIPQLRKLSGEIDYSLFGRGLYVFALGLGKKVLLADNLAVIVNAGYGNISGMSSWDVILVMVCYSLQIYFDFSGYCDMAVGIGYFFGIRLPYNFNSPYKAVSISDFWDRWHITLTQFFTKYVYIPLGGSRKGTVRTYGNILLVFLLSGFWHGANWTFLIWGLFHGLLKVMERSFHVESLKIPNWIRRIVTFCLVTWGWSLFRADSVHQAITLWRQLFQGGFHRISLILVEAVTEIFEVKILYDLGFENLKHYYFWGLCAFVVLLMTTYCFVGKNSQDKEQKMIFSTRKLLKAAVLIYWSILSLSNISSFLYVNF